MYKSAAIPIPQQKKPESEYSLKPTFIDPMKSSPPNEFLIKLRSRLVRHNSLQRSGENSK